MSANGSRQLRWNGWGFAGQGLGVGPERERGILDGLGRRLGRAPAPTPRPPATLADAMLPTPRLDPGSRRRLIDALGAESVDDGPEARARHAAGKSLPDLFRLRSGHVPRAPDAVVFPRDAAGVAAVLRVAADEGLAVVPFGGGTSVVGGVAPLAGEQHRAVLSLDTTRMNALLALDEDSGIARFGAGVMGPDLEAGLAARGYTLGHFPQSFEHSTLGGWIAARSSGQQSDGYGGIEELLVAARMVTPAGDLETLPVPRRAAGPELREVILGSEGTLGVIVDGTVRIRRRPRVTEVRGMLFRRWEEGSATIRGIREAGVPLSMIRLSDAEETAFGVLLQTDPSRGFDLKRTALEATRALGYGTERCLMLYAAEGDERRRVGDDLGRAFRVGAHHGGLPLGEAPGRSWMDNRFHTPYLRDWLLDRGVAIETLETAVPWSRLDAAHAGVITALEAALDAEAGGGIAMGHLSHSYRDGACLYFIVVYPFAGGGAEGVSEPGDDGGEAAAAQWGRIKDAAMEAVVAHGGTVSHHHGVGTDHRRWLAGEIGAIGVEALRALKGRLDPAGIMNPGKVL